MQNDQIYSEILNQIHTKDDFNEMNQELDNLEEGLFDAKNKSTPTPLIAKAIQNKDKQTVITELRKKIMQLKFMEITLSEKPNTKTVNKIFEKLSTLTSEKIALDIKIDNSIMGGAIVSYNGKYFDGTLKKSLDNILKTYV